MDARTVLEHTIAILLVFGRAINGIFRGDARRAVEFLQPRIIPPPQKGDRLLFFSLRGRPRGRNVLASPNVTAISVCHSD
jgi:hypothetical protein